LAQKNITFVSGDSYEVTIASPDLRGYGAGHRSILRVAHPVHNLRTSCCHPVYSEPDLGRP
jgi:hypothetical protein